MKSFSSPIFSKFPLYSLFVLLKVYLFLTTPAQGYEIRDLTLDGPCFSSQADPWEASSLLNSSIKTSTCSGVDLLGGYGVFNDSTINPNYFKREYANLPPHNQIRFSLTLYGIDATIIGPYTMIQISFDNIEFNSVQVHVAGSTHKCGSTTTVKPDFQATVLGKFAHNSSSLSVKILQNKVPASGYLSFGFRDFVLTFAQITETTSDLMCASSLTSLLLFRCDCTAGQYRENVSNGTCKACSPACESCFGPTSKECYKCKQGFSFNGTECVECSPDCVTCSPENPSYCTSCTTDKYLLDGVCLSNCPTPFTTPPDACIRSCQSPCPGSTFLFLDNSCQNNCLDPLLPSTLNGIQRCSSPCDSSSSVLAWDRECMNITECQAPLRDRSETGIMYCDYPCPNSDDYLHKNGTCQNICQPPLQSKTERNRLFCLNPCGTGQYLYLNGSCSETCSGNSWEEDGNRYCKTPPSGTVSNSSTCYVYPDNSCLSECDPPLQTIKSGTQTMCNSPCALSNFLYWNNTCSLQCEAPYTPKQEAGIKYCKPPCSETEYITPDGSCLSSCDPPRRAKVYGTLRICQAPCDNPLMYFYESTKECKSDCISSTTTTKQGYLVCTASQPQETQSGLVDWLLLAPTEPGTVTFVVLTKFMKYLRYFDMKLPPRLERLTASQGRAVLSLQPEPKITSIIGTWFPGPQQPRILEKQSFYPRFLGNFGGEAFVLLIIFCISVLSFLLRLTFQGYGWAGMEALFSKLQTLTAWNLCIMLFGTYLDDIILFTALEFSTIDFGSASAVISFISCLLAIIAGIGFLFAIFLVVRKSTMNRSHIVAPIKDSQPIVGPRRKWEAFQVFYAGFDEKRAINRLFFLFYTIRSVVPMFLAVTIFVSPIAQSTLQMLFSLLVVCYVIFMKPLKNKINQYQLVIIEVIVFIMNICVFGIVIQANKGQYSSAESIFFGDVTIIGNATINILLVVIMVIKLVYAMKEIKILYQKDSMRGKVSCVHLLAIPLQQAAFGFEQLLGEINPTPVTSQKQVVKEERIPTNGSVGKSPKRVVSEITTIKENPLPNLARQTTQVNTIGLENEIPDLSSTERFVQSSARLLVSSQVLDRSHGLTQINQITVNDSVFDLGPISPRNKRLLNSFLKKVSRSQSVAMTGIPNGTIQESIMQSHSEDCETSVKPLNLIKASSEIIVRSKQPGPHIERTYANFSVVNEASFSSVKTNGRNECNQNDMPGTPL